MMAYYHGEIRSKNDSARMDLEGRHGGIVTTVLGLRHGIKSTLYYNSAPREDWVQVELINAATREHIDLLYVGPVSGQKSKSPSAFQPHLWSPSAEDPKTPSPLPPSPSPLAGEEKLMFNVLLDVAEGVCTGDRGVCTMDDVVVCPSCEARSIVARVKARGTV